MWKSRWKHLRYFRSLTTTSKYSPLSSRTVFMGLTYHCLLLGGCNSFSSDDRRRIIKREIRHAFLHARTLKDDNLSWSTRWRNWWVLQGNIAMPDIQTDEYVKWMNFLYLRKWYKTGCGIPKPVQCDVKMEQKSCREWYVPSWCSVTEPVWHKMVCTAQNAIMRSLWSVTEHHDGTPCGTCVDKPLDHHSNPGHDPHPTLATTPTHTHVQNQDTNKSNGVWIHCHNTRKNLKNNVSSFVAPSWTVNLSENCSFMKNVLANDIWWEAGTVFLCAAIESLLPGLLVWWASRSSRWGKWLEKPVAFVCESVHTSTTPHPALAITPTPRHQGLTPKSTLLLPHLGYNSHPGHHPHHQNHYPHQSHCPTLAIASTSAITCPPPISAITPPAKAITPQPQSCPMHT